jgi:hypothetical protein
LFSAHLGQGITHFGQKICLCLPRLEVARNPGLPFISLKNLQNYRIGHVQTGWPSEALACYTTSRFQSATQAGR